MSVNSEKLPLFFAKMKEAFAVFKNEAPAEQKFGKAMLADGITEIMYEGDQITMGQPVMVITEAGEAPVPDGEYATSDGVKFVVSGGVVSEVEVPEVAPEAPAEAPEQMADENAASSAPAQAQPTHIIERLEKEMIFEKVAAFEQNIKDLSEKVATLEAENGKLMDELKSEKEKFQSFGAQMQKAIEEMGDAPQVQNEVKQNFRSEKKEDINEWRKRHGLIK